MDRMWMMRRAQWVKLWKVSLRRYSSQSLEKSPSILQPLNYVKGVRVTPQNEKEMIPLTYPATGEVLRTFPASGPEDINEAVKSAQDAYQEWSQLSGFQRGKLLQKAAQILRSRAEEFSQIEVLDSGKPIWEARCDVDGCADTIDYFGGLASSLTGEHLTLPGGSFNYTRREPFGVVGAIGAWNYPLQMATWKSAPALACGNAMIFKPSPFTPISAVMLAEIYTQVGIPAGCFNVVQGATQTGQLLSNHDGIKKMSFTGSVPTGSKIMAACAKGIKHVTLELGGKSPLIIFADCNLDNAVNGAILANFLNAGQVCSNGTRVFVERSVMESFLEKLVYKTQQLTAGDPMLDSTTIGAMINPEQAEKTLNHIKMAKNEGAKVVFGGKRLTLEDKRFQGGYFLSPCILSNCQDNMTVVKDEVFGSLMSLLTFDSEGEVIKRANDTTFGLAGGIFTQDLQCAHRVAAQMEAGSIYVNNYNVYIPGMPFGGFKKSGIGHENAMITMNYYTQLKSVYVEMADNIEGPV